MDLYAHAKSVIELQLCEIHKTHPNVYFIDNRVAIDCCCSDFKVICLKLLITILISHKDNKLTVAWKKPK
jgi:hypothetical protein